MIHPPTQLLAASADGDAEAKGRLTPLVYEELRRLARAYLAPDSGSTLQPTALVHEAFLKLIDGNVEYRSQTHFQAVAAVALRHALVDHVRGKQRAKRGGSWKRVTLSAMPGLELEEDLDVELLDQALSDLETVDPRGARTVELRFFGGLTEKEVAGELGVSERTVRNDWRMARAWLRVRMDASQRD